MYLIFDCSSVAKPQNYKEPYTNSFHWPRMVHLSFIVLGEDLKPIEDFDCIIKPEGYKITPAVEKLCVLEPEDFKTKAADLASVLEQFELSAKKCQYLFAHNLAYNENTLAAEYMRKNMSPDFMRLEKFCLMQEGTFFCKLPNKRGGYKWPTLNELHARCFKQQYSPGRNARADVVAAARCFIYMMKKGELEDLFDED